MTSYKEVSIAHDMAGSIVLDYDKDVAYITKERDELHLQILYPIDQQQLHKKYPCIIYMISTMEKEEEIYHYIPRMTQFAQRGYVVALMEKPSQKSTYEEQIDLIHSAVHFLIEHAGTYNIAPENMFIWRDGSHKDHIQNINFDKNILDQKDHHTEIKAVICLGEKQQIKEICSKFDFEIPPILMLFCREEEPLNLEFWTEEVFDIIEDFMTKYM